MSSGPAVGRGQELAGPGDVGDEDLVVAAQAVDLGRHLDRLVEQLLEQAVGALGEGDVLVPGVGQTVERHADRDDPGVALGADVGRDLLEDDGGVAETAPLGADAGVGAGTTELGAGHWGPPGKRGETKNPAPLPANPIWRTSEGVRQGFPSQFPIKPIDWGDHTPFTSGRPATQATAALGDLGQHVVGGAAARLQRPVAVVGGVDPVERRPCPGRPWPPSVRSSWPAIESRVPLTKSTGTRIAREVLGAGLLGLARRRAADTTSISRPSAGTGSSSSPTTIEQYRPPIDRPPSTSRSGGSFAALRQLGRRLAGRRRRAPSGGRAPSARGAVRVVEPQRRDLRRRERVGDRDAARRRAGRSRRRARAAPPGRRRASGPATRTR